MPSYQQPHYHPFPPTKLLIEVQETITFHGFTELKQCATDCADNGFFFFPLQLLATPYWCVCVIYHVGSLSLYTAFIYLYTGVYGTALPSRRKLKKSRFLSNRSRQCLINVPGEGLVFNASMPVFTGRNIKTCSSLNSWPFPSHTSRASAQKHQSEQNHSVTEMLLLPISHMVHVKVKCTLNNSPVRLFLCQ